MSTFISNHITQHSYLPKKQMYAAGKLSDKQMKLHISNLAAMFIFCQRPHIPVYKFSRRFHHIPQLLVYLNTISTLCSYLWNQKNCQNPEENTHNHILFITAKDPIINEWEIDQFSSPRSSATVNVGNFPFGGMNKHILMNRMTQKWRSYLL